MMNFHSTQKFIFFRHRFVSFMLFLLKTKNPVSANCRDRKNLRYHPAWRYSAPTLLRSKCYVPVLITQSPCGAPTKRFGLPSVAHSPMPSVPRFHRPQLSIPESHPLLPRPHRFCKSINLSFAFVKRLQEYF